MAAPDFIKGRFVRVGIVGAARKQPSDDVRKKGDSRIAPTMT